MRQVEPHQAPWVAQVAKPVRGSSTARIAWERGKWAERDEHGKSDNGPWILHEAATALGLPRTRIEPDANREIHVADAPGPGVEVNLVALERYRVDVEIRENGRTVFEPPAI